MEEFQQFDHGPTNAVTTQKEAGLFLKELTI